MPSLREYLEETFGLTKLDELRLYVAWGVVRDKMIPAFKRFFTDETAFTGYMRAGIWALYAAYTSGMLPGAIMDTKLSWYVAQFLPTIAFMIRAGDKNQSPGEIKQIANDPFVISGKP